MTRVPVPDVIQGGSEATMVEYGEQLIRGLLMTDGDVPEDEASAGAEALTARFSSAAAWAGIASADVGALEGIDEFCGDQFWSMGIEGLCEAGLLDEETRDSTVGYRSEAGGCPWSSALSTFGILNSSRLTVARILT